MVNPNAQVLGDGITKNQALPVGETAVRLKTTTEMGWLAVCVLVHLLTLIRRAARIMIIVRAPA